MDYVMIGQTVDHGGCRPVYVPVYDQDEAPEGIVLEGATTAPKGMIWMSNGKSRFYGEYRQWLVRLNGSEKDA